MEGRLLCVADSFGFGRTSRSNEGGLLAKAPFSQREEPEDGLGKPKEQEWIGRKLPELRKGDVFRFVQVRSCCSLGKQSFSKRI